MSQAVIILHGYSDERKSFEPLSRFLRSRGFRVNQIYLGDYITLEDQVTITDLAKAFRTALTDKSISTAEGSMDLLVHSTGALVAREWLTRYYLEEGQKCPLAHFLMLAPANFGSPLGHIGKTMVGRIVKGWRTNFQSGTQVLTALELASPYTRQLAFRDVLSSESYYRSTVCKTAVLVGSKPYQTGFRKLVDKNGGDGTVYVCTANLNTSALRIRFGKKNEPAKQESRQTPPEPIAFGVFPDRDHSSITQPQLGNANLGDMIVEFLETDSENSYNAFAAQCSALTSATLPDQPTDDIYHTYQNLVARVSDDLSYPVADYFLEFYEKPQSKRDELKVDNLMVKMHSEILEDVHVFGNDTSYRSFIFDLTDLRSSLNRGTRLMFSLSAAPLSNLIGYAAGAANDVSELPVSPGNTTFWRPNETLLLDLIIERTQAPQTFRLYQQS